MFLADIFDPIQAADSKGLIQPRGGKKFTKLPPTLHPPTYLKNHKPSDL